MKYYSNLHKLLTEGKRLAITCEIGPPKCAVRLNRRKKGSIEPFHATMIKINKKNFLKKKIWPKANAGY